MDSEKVFDPDSLDRKSYQNVGLLFGPIIFILMMLFSDHQDVMSMIAWRVAAVGLLMAIWWATEALPVAVTALVPLVTFDILEISSMEGSSCALCKSNYIFIFGCLYFSDCGSEMEFT